MNICVIDMGSNSFKCIVGAFVEGRYVQREMTRKTLSVGDDLARHGRISDPKLAEIEQTLSEFKAACARDGTRRVLAIGTAAFREAPNGGRAVEIAAKLGIPMEIASEERESRLAYLVGSLGRDDHAVIDNGSRSIELASKEVGREIRYSVFNLGYRVAFAEFFAGAEDPRAAIAAFRKRLSQETANASFMAGHSRLVGVEFEEMAQFHFPPAATEGRFLPLAVLQQKVDEIAGADARAFAALEKRKDIDRALPRLVVAATLAESFGYDGIELTARELGTGLIIEAGLGTNA
jgi:exopolyphosphatase / guanosine-5'-triphosphate,3'-diphosphate pyrophosphatase